MARSAAPVERRSSASQDPSGRSSRYSGCGPARSVRIRHSRSAPVSDRLAPQRIREDPPVGQQQHPRLQPRQQLLDHASAHRSPTAPTAAAKMACVPHSANATTRACGNAARSPLFTPGRPKNAVVLDGVGHIQTRPVDRDQPPPGQPPRRRARPPGRPDRPGDPLEQRPATAPHPTGPAPGRSPTCSATRYRSSPPRRPRQPIGQLRQHILIRTLGVQRHPDREVRHHPRRQRSADRTSVRPAPAITSSTRPGGNTRVNTPTDTKSDNRRSDSGFTHPARGMTTKLHPCSLN